MGHRAAPPLAATVSTTARVGYVPTVKHQPIKCARQNDHAQPCNPEGGRYRIIVRSLAASIDGYLCCNHLHRLAPALGIDPMAVGPWKE